MRSRIAALALAATAVCAPVAAGQTAPVPAQPVERVTFAEAVARAQEKNTSVAIAATGILRAEALLLQTRAATRLQASGVVTTTTLNTGVDFDGTTVVPRNQVTGALDVRYPLFASAQWARRVQAEDRKRVAELGVADARRQIAVAAANAYLSVVALRRVVAANELARDTAKAHFDLAHELQVKGSGSRLNEVRAQQEVSSDEGLVETARFALYRAQEALGVLLVTSGPVDAGDPPAFDTAMPAAPSDFIQFRTDLKLFAAEQQAAERVQGDSRKDYYPYLEGVFQPQTIYPAGFFAPANSWRFLLQLSVPIYDSGTRAAARVQRQAAVDQARAIYEGAVTQANAEVRTAREAVQSAGRALASARAAADQAHQVVTIVNVSFRAGAATNIEVIDAERQSRNADIAVAVAEDSLRRAQLDLVTALGRFPS